MGPAESDIAAVRKAGEVWMRKKGSETVKVFQDEQFGRVRC